MGVKNPSTTTEIDIEYLGCKQKVKKSFVEVAKKKVLKVIKRIPRKYVKSQYSERQLK